MNVKHDSVFIMMNVVWSCLEDNVINNGGYLKEFITHKQNEWMHEASEKVVNESL